MVKHETTYHPNYELASFKEFQNDILMKEENYNDKGRLYGVYREFTYKNDKLDGLYLTRSRDGRVFAEKTYKLTD